MIVKKIMVINQTKISWSIYQLTRKSVRTFYMFKDTDIILKHPILDYDIKSANNLKINPSPKLMDQSNFNTDQK